MKFALGFTGLLLAAVSASASVITTLPGGTAVPIPAVNSYFTTGPDTLAPGITYTGNAPYAVFGYTGGYGFASNGSWSGTSMIGLNAGNGFFDITFAQPVTSFLGELNWTVGFGNNASIQAFNAAGTLLETLTLENGANLVAPGFHGFHDAGIAKVRFNNEYIGVRNISIAAVPEPASWALMLGGFGLIGGALRRRGMASVAA